MPTAIQLRDITKRFGTGASATTAVKGVSVTVEPGELFFLLGPSGCGKTTLLRMIAGFTDPTSGSIRFKTPVGERDVTHLAPNKRNTGMVFQSYALWPHMTVAANVAFGLDVRGVSKEEKRRRVTRALELVQMGPYAERKPNQLSGGQQQRVALARALVVEPDVLLLDEPLSNLDAKLRNELRSEIRRICKTAAGGEGITGVYVTHDQKEALSMADRVAVMRDGEVVQVGPPHELYRKPGTRFVAEFLGETNLLPVTVVERKPDGVVVDSPVGRLVSSTVSGDLGEGAKEALLSIRPEAFCTDGQRGNGQGGVNAMRARVAESTYLGETAQLVCTLADGEQRAKVALLNPSHAHHPKDELSLRVDPADAVLMPAE